MFPLRLGPPDAFAAVREFLRAAGYSEPMLLDRLRVPRLHDLLFPYGLRREALNQRYQGPGLELFLARLLMGGFPTARDEASRFLPPGVLSALEVLGVVEESGGNLRAPVVVCPAAGFFLAADRPLYSDGSRGYQGADYVMSGAEAICRDYVDAIPTTPCETFLDLGCGSGLAALAASRFAVHVTATDITPRAAAFAEFNRLLNGVANMTVLTGDLFAPVEGRTFDRIASNPPFEPPLKQNLIFSVGGEDGEAILARLIAQAPGYLNPGGRLYCLVSGTDRLRETFDARARRWLGEHAEDCDLALFVRQKLAPREYALEQMLGDNSDSWKIDEWSRFYQKLEAVRVLMGYLVVQRRDAQRPVFHVRHDLAESSGIAEIDQLLDWETRAMQPEFAERLLGSHPAAAPGWQLHVRHDFSGGTLQVAEMVLRQAKPFQVELECGESLPRLLCQCDGRYSVAELFEWLGQMGAAQGEDARAEFLRGVRTLVTNGFLIVPRESRAPETRLPQSGRL